MSTLQEIESAILKLPSEDFQKLADWITGERNRKWDEQIERDIQAGNLDRLAEEAVFEYRAGKTKPFPE